MPDPGELDQAIIELRLAANNIGIELSKLWALTRRRITNASGGNEPDGFRVLWQELENVERRLAEVLADLEARASRQRVWGVISAPTAALGRAAHSATLDRARDDVATDTVSVEAYVSTNDPEIAQRVFAALNRFLYTCGYRDPTDVEIHRGSFWLRGKTSIRNGLTSDQVQSRLAQAERAIELAQLDRRQAEVNMTLSSAVSMLLASLAEIPQACIRVGALILIKYVDPGGQPVIMSRTLSQREIKLLEKYPEIEKTPNKVMEALAAALSMDMTEESL